MPVEKVYPGLPQDSEPTTGPSSVVSAAWVDWRFLVAFFVALVFFIVILLAVFCVRQRRRPTTPTEADDVSFEL